MIEQDIKKMLGDIPAAVTRSSIFIMFSVTLIVFFTIRNVDYPATLNINAQVLVRVKESNEIHYKLKFTLMDIMYSDSIITIVHSNDLPQDQMKIGQLVKLNFGQPHSSNLFVLRGRIISITSKHQENRNVIFIKPFNNKLIHREYCDLSSVLSGSHLEVEFENMNIMSHIIGFR